MQRFNFAVAHARRGALTLEVFINGQHAPPPAQACEPRLLDVPPPAQKVPQPQYTSWPVRQGAPWGPFTSCRHQLLHYPAPTGIAQRAATDNFTFGPGSAVPARHADAVPLQLQPHAKRWRRRSRPPATLHVRMNVRHPVDWPSLPADHVTTVPPRTTRARRRQQSTTCPALAPWHFPFICNGHKILGTVPTTSRPWSDIRSSCSRSVATHETQYRVRRPARLGLKLACNRVNVYGFHAATTRRRGSSLGRPVPVQGDWRATTAQSQWDVYTALPCILHVRQPSACAGFPRPACRPGGAVTFAYRAVPYTAVSTRR